MSAAALMADQQNLPILNLSFYRFSDLTEEEIRALRFRLRDHLRDRGVKGTILLATEGINGFLAAPEAVIREVFPWLQAQHPAFAGLDAKESFSHEIPFNRMLVKLKKELIPLGFTEIIPHRHTGPRLEPERLKQWLDEGRDVILLDTRNQFEVELGTFRGAKEFGLRSFREFTRELEARAEEWRDKEIVMFCTGGIRCEKATELAMQRGYRNVHQLEGGILRYFEKVGGAHYDGECFVFDKRVAVDPALRETATEQCFECRAVLTPDEKAARTHVCGERRSIDIG